MDREDKDIWNQKDDLNRLKDYHGHLSPGAVIGLHMMEYARRVMGFEYEEDIFVTVETYNCVPDAPTALANCTIGTKRLRVADYGKMALTVTKRGDPIGVRVLLDKDKTVNYPKIHLWYMNEQKIPHDEVFDDILKAGLEIYSHEYVRVKIIEKKNKNIILCSRCDEPFISRNGEDICNYCYEGGYYELD